MRFADEPIDVRADVPLAPLNTLAVGGAARWYVRAATAGQVRAAHRWAADRALPVFVLGGGSNLVVADGGIDGLVLHALVRGCELRPEPDGATLIAGAGEVWDDIVRRAVDAGLAGMECLSGIPGFVGGAPIQNVGAYGQEVSGSIERVAAVDVRTNELVEIAARECGFGYRQSRFKGADAGRFTICGVRFALRRGAPTVTYPDVVAWVARRRLDRPGVAEIRRAVLEIRRGKGMVLDAADPDTRSVGSFFVNPVVPAARLEELGAPSFPVSPGSVKIPAAWLIEQAGFLKGHVAGNAGISSKHPLAIVNRGGATAADIVTLACRIKRAVLARFGVALRPEPVFAGWGADERVRFLTDAD